MPERIALPATLDVVIVGAGFGGMYQLHTLRGLGLSARIIEAADGVGGTWYWNRYPGARCDVESMQYSFGFDPALQQEWQWSERFASQPEILRYANHVADRFDLRRDIAFETRVESAVWDAARACWAVRTDRGDAITARFVVMATGCLSAARLPEIAGIDDFQGATYHTGYWPHEPVDFTGKRVAVIGTGSSAIQAIPVIAAQAADLTVFQRTPNFSVPSHNRPMDAGYEQGWKQDYPAQRAAARRMRTGILYEISDRSALSLSEAERNAEYERRWQIGSTQFMAAFNDLIANPEANATAAEFVRAKIRGIVKDPKTAEALAPKDHPIGTKRICVDTRYYETYNQPHVHLVNLRETPIERITARGVLAGGVEHQVDVIVFATGFDAMTGALTKVDIRGEAGVSIAEAWQDGPVSYLGLMVAGFPNLFTITGPGSPSVLSNMIVSIEQHVDWITECLGWLRAHGHASIAATPGAQEAWVIHGMEVANKTLYPQAASWYMGANVVGKPRVFMPYIGGVGVYRDKCDEIAAKGYEGFVLGRAAQAAAAE